MKRQAWRPVSLGTLVALLLSLITVVLSPLEPASAATLDMTGHALSFNHTNLTATITRVATSNGVITYTASNSFTAGQLVTITGVTSNPINRFNLANVIINTASSTSFTVLNAATGTYTSGGTATQLNDYRNIVGTGVANGDQVLYYNVATISAGNTVDAVVTTTTSNSTISAYDGESAVPGKPDYFQPNLSLSGTNGKAVFRFEFYEHGTYTGSNTGTPVVLNNVTISSVDLDNGGSGYQFSEFSGFQQYTLTNNTMLTASAVTGTRLERFTTRETSNLSDVPQDMVQVTYLTLSSIDVAIGIVGSSGAIGYFGISFSAIPWGAAITDPVVGSPTTIGPRAITGIATSAGTVTYTTSANHGFSVGQSVTVTGCSTTGYNGSSMTITAVASTKKFAVTKAQTGGSCPSGSATVTIPGVVTPAIGVSNVDNPANLAPTTSNTSAILTAGATTTLIKNDFGAAAFTDADSNPFYKIKITALPSNGAFQHRISGTWRDVSLNDEILTSDIDLENLRFTGSDPVSIKFRVHDGLVYSSNEYTLGITITNRSQTITFPEPGTRAVGVTFDSGAFSDSGLDVTLSTTQTGVCTIVNALQIRTEAEGECVVTASQRGNSTYSKATDVVRTVHVSGRLAQAVTFADPGRQILDSTPKTIASSATANSNLAVQLVSQTLDVCTVDGLNIILNAAGPCEVWAKQEGNATYAPATTIKHNFEVALPSWSVTFHKNLATSGTVPPAVDVTKTLSVKAPTNSGSLQLTGYSFAGWNTQANGRGSVTYQPGDLITPSADLTLYAKWSASITYDSNGATSGTVPDVQSVLPGINSLAQNSGTLQKSSHTFAGWNTLSTGLGTSYAVGADFTVSGDVTLYAKWTSVITFSGNSPTRGSPPDPSLPAVDSNVALPTNSGTSALVRNGHTFAGWNTNQQGTGTNYLPGVDTFPLTGNVTLYARWISTITYDANGGTGDVPTAQSSVDGNVRLDDTPSNLTKGDLIFDHWSLTDDGSTGNYGSGATFALTGNTTLFAIYAKRSYLRIVTPPKISQNSSSVSCTRGTFAYMEKGVTPLLASPTLANVFLMVNGVAFSTAKPAVSSSSVSWFKTDLASIRSGSSLTCRVVANQGGITPLTSESSDSPLAISLRAQQTKELNTIEATYQGEINAAIAKQKAALAANPKSVLVFNATFKAEFAAAQTKRDAAIATARAKRISEVAKAGIALIWP